MKTWEIDDDLHFCGPFNHISVVLSPWKSDSDRLYAMKPCLQFERTPLSTRLESRLLTQQSFGETIVILIRESNADDSSDQFQIILSLGDKSFLKENEYISMFSIILAKANSFSYLLSTSLVNEPFPD